MVDEAAAIDRVLERHAADIVDEIQREVNYTTEQRGDGGYDNNVYDMGDVEILFGPRDNKQEKTDQRDVEIVIENETGQ